MVSGRNAPVRMVRLFTIAAEKKKSGKKYGFMICDLKKSGKV